MDLGIVFVLRRFGFGVIARVVEGKRRKREKEVERVDEIEKKGGKSIHVAVGTTAKEVCFDSPPRSLRAWGSAF